MTKANQYQILRIELANGKVVQVPIPYTLDDDINWVRSVTVSEPMDMPKNWSFSSLDEMTNSGDSKVRS